MSLATEEAFGKAREHINEARHKPGNGPMVVAQTIWTPAQSARANGTLGLPATPTNIELGRQNAAKDGKVVPIAPSFFGR